MTPESRATDWYRHGAMGALTVIGFLGLQSAYSALRPLAGASGAAGLLLDRGLYALIFAGVAYLWFFVFLPFVFLLERGPPWSQDGPGRVLRGPDLPRGLIAGSLVGLLLLPCMWAYHHYLRPFFGDGPAPAPPDLAAALRTAGGLAFYLPTTGLLTPLLEEIFYRGILIGFCLRQNLRPAFAVVLSAALFALVHAPGVRPLLLGIGLALGFLFWRCGLVPAVLAHSIYNAGILLYTFLTHPVSVVRP